VTQWFVLGHTSALEWDYYRQVYNLQIFFFSFISVPKCFDALIS